MSHKPIIFTILSVLCASILAGCSVVQSFMPTATATNTPTFTATPAPPTPTPTEVPFYIDATVFSGELQVPILIYHQFIPDQAGVTTAMKMQLSEFRNELEILYENGFSLVSLESWVNGTFVVPPGRKPLIITLDDAWFANQLFIGEDGVPSKYSGLGVLWNFYQEHPDFGFHAAMFAINGDKFYAVKQVGDQFFGADNAIWTTPSWRIKLGNTIAWAIDHGIEAYNHTLKHPNLSSMNNADIQDQLYENDVVMRAFLHEAGRDDIIPKLNNMIALPEGKWPESQSGKNVVLNYKNPEGKPVAAVLEAYNMDSVMFTPSFFSEGFNPYAIPRITASPYFVHYIIDHKDQIPTAGTCRLGPTHEDQSTDQAVLQELITNAVNTQACPEGVYHVSGYIFFAYNGEVTLHSNQGSAENPPEGTATPTP